MSSLARQLRDAFDRAPSISLDDVRERAQATSHRSHRSRNALMVGVAVVAVSSAIALVAKEGSHSNPRIVVAGSPTTRDSTGVTTSLPVTNRATISITLDRTTLPADGSAILGIAVVNNMTQKPISVPSGTCRGWIEVGLTSSDIQFDGTWPAEVCAALEIPVGMSQYRISVSTTYPSCIDPGGSGGPNVPMCTGASSAEPPPLPPGTYSTKTVGLPENIEPPSSINVVLTPANK